MNSLKKFEDTKGVIRNLLQIEGQTIQWPNEKLLKDKQRSTKPYTEN